MKNIHRKILFTDEVMAILRYKSRSGFDMFRTNEKNEFPKPVRIGTRRLGWFADEVDNWLQNNEKGII